MRLGVALLLPAPAASEVDGLRRGCGDGSLARVPPHITLVPPVNVRETDISAALGLLRDAAAATHPLVLAIGPPSSFDPDNPTMFLRVGGDEKELIALRGLRDRVFRPPLERSLTWPFVPHVTIADDMSPERMTAAIDGLADFELVVRFARVHLLQEQSHGDPRRRWIPIADCRFEPRRVVGRGGLPLELTITEILDPEARRFETGEWPSEEPPGYSSTTGTGAGRSVVVVARREREGVVGVARGWCEGHTHELDSVLVARAVRGQGVGSHLLAAFEHACRTAQECHD